MAVLARQLGLRRVHLEDLSRDLLRRRLREWLLLLLRREGLRGGGERELRLLLRESFSRSLSLDSFSLASASNTSRSRRGLSFSLSLSLPLSPSRLLRSLSDRPLCLSWSLWLSRSLSLPPRSVSLSLSLLRSLSLSLSRLRSLSLSLLRSLLSLSLPLSLLLLGSLPAAASASASAFTADLSSVGTASASAESQPLAWAGLHALIMDRQPLRCQLSSAGLVRVQQGMHVQQTCHLLIGLDASAGRSLFIQSCIPVLQVLLLGSLCEDVCTANCSSGQDSAITLLTGVALTSIPIRLCHSSWLVCHGLQA